MTDIPIIFSAPMVRALLDGRKTMTRRMLYIKRKARNGVIPASSSFLQDHPPPCPPLGPSGFPTDIGPDEYYDLSPWQRIKSGDRLWVKETFTTYNDGSRAAPRLLPMYAADFEGFNKPERDWNWTSGRFMKRAYSRITLIVNATKIERLQDISDHDCFAEGVMHADEPANFYTAGPTVSSTPQGAFAGLWEGLHGARSWSDNPEVVAPTFAVHNTNIDAMQPSQAA